MVAPWHRLDYADFEHLAFDRRPDGVVVVTLNRPEVLNAANVRMHREMSEVWAVIDADPDARVSVVTGAGRAFSAGGDLDMIAEMTEDYEAVLEQWRDARTIVECMLSADKPVVSAINGVAVGAGLAVALMADISIMGESARVSDGHARLGVAAGDHAALLWPLLCGMAKAKYYLLTADFIAGPEAERIGLVTEVRPRRRRRSRGAGRGRAAGGRERHRRAVDEAGHEPLVAPGASRLRGVRRPRDARVPRARRPRGPGRDQGASRASVSRPRPRRSHGRTGSSSPGGGPGLLDGDEGADRRVGVDDLGVGRRQLHAAQALG